MPNWCYNNLYVCGPTINEVLNAIAGENGALDFEKIIPMPEAIRNTESGTKSEVALACAKDDMSDWKDMPWVKNGEVTTTHQLAAHCKINYEEAIAYGKQLLQNLQAYGATTWYDWCRNNWGCKWNTRDSAVVQHLETSAQLRFVTPWGPPMPVIRALALKFREHSFKLEYAEYEYGFAGIFEVKDEEIIQDTFETFKTVYEEIVTDDCAVTPIEETGGTGSIRDE